MFNKAVKTESKLRLAIAGPSGSGKTYTALAVGTALADGGRVAVLDTEHGSASKYADLYDFDVLNESAPFHPDKVTAAINDAARGGYSVLILDSMSHFWNGPGGMTDIVEDISRRMKSPNSFAAWKDGTPIQQRMIEAIVSAPLHIIATIRSKQDYVLETNANGRQVPRKVGMAPIQRDGFEYEFDVFMDMDNDNTGVIAKTRCPALTNGVFKKPGSDIAAILRDWLHGAPPPPMKQFTDGSIVPANAMTHYDAYVAVHDGLAPENVDTLREWFKSQRNRQADLLKAMETPIVDRKMIESLPHVISPEELAGEPPAAHDEPLFPLPVVDPA